MLTTSEHWEVLSGLAPQALKNYGLPGRDRLRKAEREAEENTEIVRERETETKTVKEKTEDRTEKQREILEDALKARDRYVQTSEDTRMQQIKTAS